MQRHNRRKIIKKIGIGAAWTTPVIQTIVLPVHAQTSSMPVCNLTLTDVSPPSPSIIDKGEGGSLSITLDYSVINNPIENEVSIFVGLRKSNNPSGDFFFHNQQVDFFGSKSGQAVFSTGAQGARFSEGRFDILDAGIVIFDPNRNRVCLTEIRRDVDYTLVR